MFSDVCALIILLHGFFVCHAVCYSWPTGKGLGSSLSAMVRFQVYCVVGGCDAGDEHGEVARTADDYLWLKLSAIKARPGNEADSFSYGDLQKLILEEYGMIID